MSYVPSLSPQDVRNYFGGPSQPEKPSSCFLIFVLVVYTCLVSPFCYFILTIPYTNVDPGKFDGRIIAVIGLYIPVVVLVALIIRALRSPNDISLPPTDQAYEALISDWQTSLCQYGMQRLGLSADEMLECVKIAWSGR
jgi:hypothetical protein